MSDEADLGNEAAELFLSHALLNRAPAVRATGFCHYCGEPVAGDLRFCNADCRDDFEAEQRAKRRAGLQ